MIKARKYNVKEIAGFKEELNTANLAFKDKAKELTQLVSAHNLLKKEYEIMTPCEKRPNLIICKCFKYYPRGYIEGGYYYFFIRPSIAGIIRMQVLFEGGPYMRKYGT